MMVDSRASLRLLALGLVRFAAAQHDYSQYVNAFIGGEGPTPGLATGGGDIFVGGAVPFGMAKVGIDTYELNLTTQTINGGWTPLGLVTGISMMHESGTGGPPKYGIISQMPLTTIDAPVNLLDNTTYWQKRTVVNDTASVGYYSTQLENGVTLEIAGARHSGLISYDFPAGEKHVLVDLSHFLPDTSGANTAQFYDGGSITIEDGGKRYFGWGSYGGGFSNSAPATTYFCGEFDQMPEQAHTFRGRNTEPVMRQHTLSNEPIPHPTYRNRSTEESGPLTDRVGAVFTWPAGEASTIKSRIGISFISSDKACSRLDEQISSWNLSDIVAAAVEEWNRDVFSKIQVPVDSSQNQTNQVLLYSHL
jgi:putative alpha-1,2-mannosidase